MKKTVVFATATYSLAETQRMTQIAKEVANNGSFDVIVAHYTPKDESFSFSHIIEDEHLNAFLLEPHMTKELSTHIFEVDRGEKMGSIIPIDILKKR